MQPQIGIKHTQTETTHSREGLKCPQAWVKHIGTGAKYPRAGVMHLRARTMHPDIFVPQILRLLQHLPLLMLRLPRCLALLQSDWLFPHFRHTAISLPVAFGAIVGGAKHLAVVGTGAATLAPRLNMVGVHFGEFPNLLGVGRVATGA